MADDRGEKPIEIYGEAQTATAEWDRFQHYLDLGHANFVEDSRRNYRYFRGNGGQWTDADRKYMESVTGRKCIEVNGILPAVQTAVGEQISTRADIGFKPARGQASVETAKVLNQITMHILANNNYFRAEKQVFRDGLIKRRGWIDVRLSFEGNTNGEITIREINPEMVIPDPYATSPDPRTWRDVTLYAWMTLDEIEGRYGREARIKAEKHHQAFSDNPYSELFASHNKIDDRYGFATEGVGYVEFERQEAGERRLRVIERQFHRYDLAWHYVNPQTGDLELVPANESPAQAKAYADANGLLLQKHNVQRVRWRVSTRCAVLHDDWSPYRTFTLIPFFYIFDYGDAISMVDNAIGPQDLLNKSLTNDLHIQTTTSNSGWKVPRVGDKSTLTNMTPRELAEKGMKSGLVIEYDKDIGEPSKISPNQVPVGMERLADRGEAYIKVTTGISDAEMGMDSPEVSGIAIGRKQRQAKLQLADPLDNLQYTRTLVGRKVVELLQDFYTAERIFKIIDTDKRTGEKIPRDVVINQVDPAGRILNDITVGEYEVVVTSKPLADTFSEGEFAQLFSLRTEAGVAIPDDELVRRSDISDKFELAERLANPQDDGTAAAQAAIAQKQAEKLDAEVKLLSAKRDEAVARATNTNVQAMFGATNAGNLIAQTPAIAPLADELMLSAGFEDKNQPPVIPSIAAPIETDPALMVPQNTSPNFPPQADRGFTQGIEGGQ